MYRSSTAYYYDVDGLGSVNLLNDTSGTVQDKYLYDGWGITRSSTTPVANPFVYTARETAEVGLFYYRARYYNPNIGRFVSEDPLRRVFAPKKRLDLHDYLYVTNLPVRFSDPSGVHKLPAPHPTCPSCTGDIKNDVENAAGRACDVVSTPHCQLILGSLKSCMTQQCRGELFRKPNIVCNKSPWCDPQNDLPAGIRPKGDSDPSGRIIICTNHNDWRTNPHAEIIFHEMLHGCKRSGDHEEYQWKYIDPCFGGGNHRKP